MISMLSIVLGGLSGTRLILTLAVLESSPAYRALMVGGFGQTLDDREAGGRSAGAKVTTNRPESVEWDSGMLQTLCEREVEEAEEADSNLRPQQRQIWAWALALGLRTLLRHRHPPPSSSTIHTPPLDPPSTMPLDHRQGGYLNEIRSEVVFFWFIVFYCVLSFFNRF